MYQRLIWIKIQHVYSVKESSRLRLSLVSSRHKTELHVRKLVLLLQGVFQQP